MQDHVTFYRSFKIHVLIVVCLKITYAGILKILLNTNVSESMFYWY